MQNTHLQRRPPSRAASASSGSVTRFVEGPASWLITFLFIPALLIAALLLPPVRLHFAKQRTQCFLIAFADQIISAVLD